MWVLTFLACIVLLGTSTKTGYSYGGGGEREEETESSSSFSGQTADDVPKKEEGGGSVGFGAPPHLVAAWEKAGGRKGTGMSFRDWFKKVRADVENKVAELEKDQRHALTIMSLWNGSTLTWEVKNEVGKKTQFIMNFIPGTDKVNIVLDGARAGAEGYGASIAAGLTQQQALAVAGETAAAGAAFSAATNIINTGQKGKMPKINSFTSAVKNSNQINKAVTTVLVTETVKDKAIEQHIKNTIENTASIPGVVEQ